MGYYVSGREASDKYEKGIIIRQETEANKKVDKNTQINVVVSTGVEEKTVQVPDVTGWSESEAQQALENSGLVVDSQAEYSDSVQEGSVISTDPGAGAEVKEGTKVKMIVSLGAEKAAVPDQLSLILYGDSSPLRQLCGLCFIFHSQHLEHGLQIF